MLAAACATCARTSAEWGEVANSFGAWGLELSAIVRYRSKCAVGDRIEWISTEAAHART
jgi:hypothetical protein